MTIAHAGRPTNPEVSIREYRKQEKYLRQQVSRMLPILGDAYPELIQKAVHIALHDTTGEGLRMLRFLIELPFKYVPVEEEADTLASQLREKWTHTIERTARRKDSNGESEEAADTRHIVDAEYRVVSPAS
ncbi:MAG TPA: hypothetical protein ACFYED_00220 [Candidatus Tripitaka californicus]|uniref:hypothetical protein n=1 Tax=Candidatus Tripitaka californicus TaxID=3367616 RepID=UPI004028D730